MIFRPDEVVDALTIPRMRAPIGTDSICLRLAAPALPCRAVPALPTPTGAGNGTQAISTRDTIGPSFRAGNRALRRLGLTRRNWRLISLVS